MKSVIIVIVGIAGSFFSLSAAAGGAGAQSTEIEKVYAEEISRDHSGGGHGHGHHGGHHYHHTEGTELFSGDEWLLAIPLLLIPLIALGCWYFWGGRGHDDYGWDRMGYAPSSAAGAYTGEYGNARGADTLDKSTHQRIFNSIQQ